MVYAVQLYLGFRNTARRDGSQTNIINQTAGKPMFGELVCVPGTSKAGDPSLAVIARFMNQADRDALWASLDAQLGTGINGPVTGSHAFTHDCSHDGTGECLVALTRAW